MKSLSTALRVLGAFANSQKPLGVVDLAGQFALTKGQISKILASFREQGFLEQDPVTRKYTVGISAFALGNNFVNSDSLSREALPVMRKLVDETGHSAVLSVRRGDNVIHLLAVEGRLFVDGRWRVGRWMPYHTTSSGRVLLAFGPDAAIDALVGNGELKQLTPNSVTDPKKLRAEVKRVRQQGFSVTRSETHMGTGSIAVPLFAHEPHAVASLGLICPEHLLSEDEVQRLIAPLQRSARELSIRMGATAYPFGR